MRKGIKKWTFAVIILGLAIVLIVFRPVKYGDKISESVLISEDDSSHVFVYTNLILSDDDEALLIRYLSRSLCLRIAATKSDYDRPGCFRITTHRNTVLHIYDSEEERLIHCVRNNGGIREWIIIPGSKRYDKILEILSKY